jgi:peptide/nickel transport system permease protein
MFKFLVNCWRGSGKFKFGVITLAVLVFISLIAPLIYNQYIHGASPALPGQFRTWMPASSAHPMGTDGHGRDLLTDYLAGLGTSLQIGFISGIVATFLGILVGFVTGYKGGWIDNVLTLITNTWLVIPAYPVLVTIAMVMPGISIITMAVILALFSWPYAARTIHAQIVGMKQRGYVELAKVSGQGDLAIIFTELLPNLIPYLFMGFAFSTVGAMVGEVGLEVIGLGPSNIITMGLMINYANGWAAYSRGRYELLLIPVGTLVLIFMAITMINRGMEERVNPRLQRRTEK